jgi:hypothetical protein
LPPVVPAETETVTLCVAVPPVPLHAMVKVEVLVSAPVDFEPAVASVPVHAPDAVQAVALLEDHVSVAAPPLVTVVGEALRDTLGAGAETVTVAVCEAVPPAPVHVSVYLVVAVNAAVARVPLVASAPAQPPDPVQAVAFVEDHVRVEIAPLLTVLGLALMVTAGAGVVTETVADCVALPPAPVQVRL